MKAIEFIEQWLLNGIRIYDDFIQSWEGGMNEPDVEFINLYFDDAKKAFAEAQREICAEHLALALPVKTEDEAIEIVGNAPMPTKY